MTEQATEPETIQVLCTRCDAVWQASVGCPCDCLVCGNRIVAPSSSEILEERRARKRREIVRIK
jgi:hypothetical protein